MVRLGAFHELAISAEHDNGVLLGDDAVFLPRNLVPRDAQLGSVVRVFVYSDVRGRAMATTRTPAADIGEFAHLEVVGSFRHGVFMNWGLEKDLFVPHGEHMQPMALGRWYVVAITVDAEGRVMGSRRIGDFLDREPSGLRTGDPVSCMVYETHERGFKVIVANRYAGLVYHDELNAPLHVGTRLRAKVAQIRSDGKIDIALRARGREARDENVERLLQRLRENEGFLALNDSSDPAEIQAQLRMSKKAFKRAVGGLFKTGQLSFEGEGIRLNQSANPIDHEAD